MKATRSVWSLVAVAAFAMFSAQSAVAAPGTGILGTKHDFTTRTGQVCAACHAPHNALTTTVLWNHMASTATYTLYTSPTMKAVAGQPGATSKLCLSCHDGTVAIDNFGTVTTATNKLTGSANIGTDLSRNHPIGITYAVDPGLKLATAAATIGTNNVGTVATKLLIGGLVECASCHDVHSSPANTANSSGLLKIDKAGSALCLACHVK